MWSVSGIEGYVSDIVKLKDWLIDSFSERLNYDQRVTVINGFYYFFGNTSSVNEAMKQILRTPDLKQEHAGPSIVLT